MAKITKSEFLNNIAGIINENLNPDTVVDYTKQFEIHNYVSSLLNEGQRDPKLMSYLNNYNNYLNQDDVKEYTIFEQFGQGLAQYATGNKQVKGVINEMNNTLKEHGNELQAYCLIECIQDPVAQKTVRCAYDNYLNGKDEVSRSILIDAIDSCDEMGDPVAPRLTIIIANDDVPDCVPQIEITGPSKFDEIQAKIRDEKERKRMEELQAKVDDYARQVFDEAEAEKQAEREACCCENIFNKQGLNLRESIRNIVSSEAKSNKKLMETIDQYAGALNQGLFEERLYEGFIKNISKFNYLLPVDKEIKRINEVAKQHAPSILVTKILEEMIQTSSYYIVPLIEEDAARYVKNPSDTNRIQLRVALASFAADPYCHAMLEAIERDDIASANTLGEKALNINDQIKFIHEHANISSLYSPVQYIKENECVFNANGQYFVKKGNTLAKLSTEYLDQLSEKFVTLVQLVNDPRVTIDDDSITLVGTDKIASIHEGYVDINGNRETTDTLRNLNEMCIKYDYDTNFFIMASCLHENFNNIAKIDFAKHISLNENEGINVDMFRLGNNIFINAVNEDIDKNTFYHNVNPIQCRNIINKHMGINVSSLFEDLMPSQDKILLKLNETKNEYELSIEKYEATIAKLKSAKDECITEDGEKKLDDAIKSAEKKVDELKKEYKDWQKEVEKQTAAKDDAENTDVEDTNKPIDAEDVKDVKAELEEPLTDEASDTENEVEIEEQPEEQFEEQPEEDPEISDEEFNSYLEDETEVPQNVIDDADDIEVIDAENQEIDNFDDEDIYEDNVEQIPDGYKIADISFDRNFKTNEIFKTGNVVVVVPMVDGNGKLYVESQTFPFYLDTESNTPIVDAGGIPVALYNAIVNAIQDSSEYEVACNSGIAEDETDIDKVEEPYLTSDEIEAASDELEKNDDNEYFDFTDTDNNLTISPKEETMTEVQPEDNAEEQSVKTETQPEVTANDIFDNDVEKDIVIPTYTEGETEIELPAPSVDGTEIPEEETPEAKEVVDNAIEDIKDTDAELNMDNENDFPAYDDVDIENEPAEINTEDSKEAEETEEDDEDIISDEIADDEIVEEPKRVIKSAKEALEYIKERRCSLNEDDDFEEEKQVSLVDMAKQVVKEYDEAKAKCVFSEGVIKQLKDAIAKAEAKQKKQEAEAEKEAEKIEAEAEKEVAQEESLTVNESRKALLKIQTEFKTKDGRLFESEYSSK